MQTRAGTRKDKLACPKPAATHNFGSWLTLPNSYIPLLSTGLGEKEKLENCRIDKTKFSSMRCQLNLILRLARYRTLKRERWVGEKILYEKRVMWKNENDK